MSRPSYLLSSILHLAANARIMRLREVDFGAELEYTSFDDRVTTFRFVSRVKRPLCSLGNLVIINSTGNYHSILLVSYASYIYDVCSSTQISSNEIRKSVNLNCTTVAQYSDFKDKFMR